MTITITPTSPLVAPLDASLPAQRSYHSITVTWTVSLPATTAAQQALV